VPTCTQTENQCFNDFSKSSLLHDRALSVRFYNSFGWLGIVSATMAHIWLADSGRQRGRPVGEIMQVKSVIFL